MINAKYVMPTNKISLPLKEIHIFQSNPTPFSLSFPSFLEYYYYNVRHFIYIHDYFIRLFHPYYIKFQIK
ncbi:uncharacterized protein DS421_5g162230 [Arachis hypogaea]|nr:uncharacterized protein DS421_5g162230 [Arachis hypogaea]